MNTFVFILCLVYLIFCTITLYKYHKNTVNTVDELHKRYNNLVTKYKERIDFLDAELSNINDMVTQKNILMQSYEDKTKLLIIKKDKKINRLYQVICRRDKRIKNLLAKKK